MAGPDYILDLKSITPPPPEVAAAEIPPVGFTGRPWLAVKWKCCSTYSRIYRNAQGTNYHGSCPRCGKPVDVKVGEGGTANRFFEAS